MAEERKGSIRSSDSEFRDRRSSQRIAFDASVALVDINSNSRLAARTADLNRRGCFINTVKPLALGTLVGLRLSKETLSFKATAQVVNVRIEKGMALVFGALDLRQLQILDNWIQAWGELKAQKPEELPDGQIIESTFKTESLHPLIYLILVLVQKSVLSETEGKILLEKALS